MSEVNLMQGESETFWSRVRSALGAGRTQQAAERAPGYGQAALARSLGMKPRLGSRLEEELTEAWQVSGAAKVSLSLLVVEIDRYSDYFNAYGRSLAEECVATVFQTISETLPRAQDHCFKLGRNQFVVVLSDYPVLLARVAAQKIAAAIHDEGIAHKESHAGIVTASVGVAVSNPSGSLDRKFFEAAIGALNKAKRRGLNRVEAVELRKARTRKAA